MGTLVDGVWHRQSYAPERHGGKFVRAETQFRDWITRDGRPAPGRERGFKAEPGRYHLYVSLACPWAHRTLIFRKLKKLEDVISTSVVHHFLGEDGWTFLAQDGGTGDHLYGLNFLHEVYSKAAPHYSGRVSVPVLWDGKEETIVSNESAEIIRMFNAAFDEWGDASVDFYPEPLRSEIDRLNTTIYTAINNGVYRAGFASKQEAYEEAFDRTVCHAGYPRGQALAPALSDRRSHHRGGLAAVHDVGALRSGLFRPFQMQFAPHCRLPQPIELSSRSLSGTRRGRDSRYSACQEALLWQSRNHQSDTYRAGRARNRQRCPA